MAELGKYLALSAVCWFFLTQWASAADCRWFGRDAQKAIKTHVAALQRLEHEASDRLKGLDTRPFPILADEAKKIATVIADPVALEDEKGLERCRNATKPIRRICADAAQAFVSILDKHRTAEKAEYDKPQYATAIEACEKLMDLKPLKSAIRGTD